MLEFYTQDFKKWGLCAGTETIIVFALVQISDSPKNNSARQSCLKAKSGVRGPKRFG